MNFNKISIATVLFLLTISSSVFAQKQKTTIKRKKEFYFSWGYNKEWYTNSKIKISQPSLGNNYSFINVNGHDHIGWDEGIFKLQPTIPQYNYRIGLFIDEARGLAVEINFDHTKFIFRNNQNVQLKGTLNNRQVDTTINFAASNGFYYFLNNGANFLLFNIVKRKQLYLSNNEKFKLDFLGKAGIGPVIPHVQNSFFGNANKPQFQFGGWNIGAEAAIRATFWKHVYLEYCNKLDYARYSNLEIYQGTAKQAFGTYEMILNLGFTFPVGGKIKMPNNN